MSPRHHPDEGLLLDFATGAMAPGPRLVVAAHLSACQACRAAVAGAEAVGGALLATLAPAAMRTDALALALARIERPDPVIPPAEPARSDWIEVPQEVLRAAAKRRRWAAPGVWVAPIGEGPGPARSYLLRVGAGMTMPRHTHRGPEMILVLKGAYADGEIRHQAGDFACNDESIEHQPRITADGECVCLVAAHGALVPRDWVGRLFQPIVGI